MTRPTKKKRAKKIDGSSNVDVNMETTSQEGDIERVADSNNNDTANSQQDSQMSEEKWKEVKRKKRYVTRILATDVPGYNWEEKTKVISNGLLSTTSIIGIRSAFEKNKKYITINFATQED